MICWLHARGRLRAGKADRKINATMNGAGAQMSVDILHSNRRSET